MRAKTDKPIRRPNAAAPMLASLVAASAYLVGALVFSAASTADAVPDRAIRYAAIAEAPQSPAERAPAPEMSLPDAVPVMAADVVLPVPVSTSPVVAAPVRPRLALIIDDVGLDPGAAARVLALGAPLTIAVLPYADQAAAIARTAEAGGRDVLVHVPMEPLGLEDPGPHALRVDLDDADLRARIRWAMARVPGAVGLNNHMGSRFTADPRALRIALSAIAGQGPLFVDSMTTAESRGLAVADGLGLAALRRDVFLDHVIEADAIHERLAEALELARTQGYAVMIGHPHEATLAALETWVVAAQGEGFDFVTVTQLSRQIEAERAPQITASASILN